MSLHLKNSLIGCEEGFERYGSSCYKNRDVDWFWHHEAKCNQQGASLWAPRKVGDMEMIQDIFK